MTKFLKDNWTLILILVYVVSPIDILPEAIIPLLGYSDDVTLLVFEVIRRLAKSREKTNDGREVIDGEEV